ncbi:transcriptional regulator RefZ [Bacillaceae bacterium]
MGRTAGETKEKIVAAAMKLFDSQGFDGTTVRQIAKEAQVNLALISYYFKNKKGLLEYLMVRFYEEWFRRLDEELAKLPCEDVLPLLKAMIKWGVLYQKDNYQVTRLIQRELTVESTLAREIMGTYLSKQKHYFRVLLEEGIARGEFAPVPIEMTIINILSMMQFPYFNPRVIREVYYLEPVKEEFVEELIAQIWRMLDRLLLPRTAKADK